MFVQCSARDGAPVSLWNITSEGEDKKKVEESTSEPRKAEYADEGQRRLTEQRKNYLFDCRGFEMRDGSVARFGAERPGEERSR